MATNFYIQFDGELAVDIESTYGIRVTSVRGLEAGDPKEIFKREWAAEDGTDYYIPATRKRQATTVTLTALAEDTQASTAKYKYDTFIAAIFDGIFDYWDTLQNRKVNVIFESAKPMWYQLFDVKKVEFTVTMFNPTGASTNTEIA